MTDNRAKTGKRFGRISLFVLVDALGWELVRTHNFLSDILPFRNAMETVLGFSSAAIPTILSGAMPESHGHWSLFKKARGLSCFTWTIPLLVLPRRLRENHRTRSFVSALTRRMYGISGYFCLYEVPVSMLHVLDYVERKDLWAPGGLSGCSSIFDRLAQSSVPYYSSGWTRSDEEKSQDSVEAISSGALDCCFLYLSELDATLHTYGLETRESKEALAAAGVRIRRLLSRAEKLYTTVDLFVFSDHGMTPVTDCRDLGADIASSGLEKSGYRVFLDATMARFWTKEERERTKIESALGGFGCGRVLSEEDRKELGLRFRTNEYGDVIFVMDAGRLIVPSHVGGRALKAMHGFHPSDVHSRASFLSSKEINSPPRHIRDMFSLFVDRLELGVPEKSEGAESRSPGRNEEESSRAADSVTEQSGTPQF